MRNWFLYHGVYMIKLSYGFHSQRTRIHYNDVIMTAMASQITDVSIVCSTVCSGADQRIHQNSASLAFVRGIHRWPVDSPYKGPVTQKMFPFDDVIMAESNFTSWYHDVYGSSSTRYKASLVCCISPRVSPYITNATYLLRMILKSIIWAHDIFP